MISREVTIKIKDVGSEYVILIVHDLLAASGDWARKCLGHDASKIAIVSNPIVSEIYGEQVVAGLTSAGFEVFVWLMEDGEEHKDLKNVSKALDFFAESGISRTDAVVALGGGVVGDLAGFAAAIYLRGIAFLQMPTTLLSMIDSSVGGKTGVNAAAGKNRIGSFHQPLGVLIDTKTLTTLPERELTAGLCEMIKHGTLSGKKLLTRTSDFLEKYPLNRFSSHHGEDNFKSEISNLIFANVTFKAKIVAGDERESSKRTDAKSRKILNFGHTLAHALEKVTNYKYFKHGEAVGYGILYAAELSKILALMDQKDVNLLNDVVRSVGTLPPLTDIDPQKVFEAFRFDKKLVAGSLQMILLKGIGEPIIVNGDEIPRSTHISVLEKLFLQVDRT